MENGGWVEGRTSSSRRQGDAGQPEAGHSGGGGTQSGYSGTEVTQGKGAWPGWGGAWARRGLRASPAPTLSPSLRQSSGSPTRARARWSPDHPSDTRTWPWRHCRHCCASVLPPRTWRGSEVRRPQSPSLSHRSPNARQQAWHAARLEKEPKDHSLPQSWVPFASSPGQG